jgi:thioredoxin reductase (NADPH)
LIVGSGPAGYTAAIYAARAGLKPLVVASSVEVGGNLVNTTEIENFPGFPNGIAGPDLMDNMRAQAERLGAELVYDDAVEITADQTIKQVRGGSGAIWQAPTLILATGQAYRRLGLDDERRLTGRGVSYCATCDGAFFKGKPVAIVGGGDSAVGEATYLAHLASQVTVIHRRDTLRAARSVVDSAMAEPNLDFVWNSQVTGILGEQFVTGLEVTNLLNGQRDQLKVDAVFVAIGHTPRSDLVKDQLALDEHGYIKVDSPSTRTSVAGVFACGDVVDPTYRQAITAAASGAKAALDAAAYLEQSARELLP